MASKSENINELRGKFEKIETLLAKPNESQLLTTKQISNFQDSLLALINKHIPPEMCSEMKLMERINEADQLIDDIQLVMGEEKGTPATQTTQE